MPARTTASVSMPAACMPSTSPKWKPSSRSITSMRRVDQRRVGPGHDEGALVERGKGHGDIEHVLGLEPEVELLDDRLGEELDQGRRVGQRGDWDPAHQCGASQAMTARSWCTRTPRRAAGP